MTDQTKVLLPVTQDEESLRGQVLDIIHDTLEAEYVGTYIAGMGEAAGKIAALLSESQSHSLPGDVGTVDRIWAELVKTQNLGPDSKRTTLFVSRRDVENALAAALTPSPCPGDGWLSIDTAPRDGTWFIADGGGCERPTPMKWNNRIGAWECDAVMLEDWDDQTEGYSRPERWWPIPAAPKEDNHSA